MRKRGDSAEYTLNEAQVQELLRNCVDLVDKIIIGCQLFLGLRVSELVHLNADWVTEGGNIKIPMQMACNCAECKRNRSGIWKPKTKAGARELPVPSRLRKDLSELIKTQPHGLSMSRIAIYYRTKQILKRAKIKFKGLAKDTSYPHSLRATCLTMLALGDMSPAGLAYFAGWSNIAIASHYISVTKAKGLALKEALEIFG